MARADLILELVKYAVSGNRGMSRKVAESIIADERDKQHKVLADRLQNELARAQKSEQQSQINGHLPNLISEVRVDNFIDEREPKKTLDDLVLPSEVTWNCRQLIGEQFRADLLRSYGVEPRHRILLIGPPGNGKTSLAEAIAESMMAPLYVVKYDAIVGAYLGETAMRLKKLLDYVSTRKCVLFFDEFETIGKERGDLHETGEIKRVVSSLLMQMDQLPSYVTIIGATNHPELLDRAVWRRFQIRLYLPKPTRAGIMIWLERFQQEHNLRFEYSSETLAKRLYGCSYAEVEEFGLQVLREYVLELPSGDIQKIVSSSLKNWESITYKTDSLTNTKSNE